MESYNEIAIILASVYLSYLLISFLILKPIVNRKVSNQVGGKVIMGRDPLIWLLPIILVLVFIALYIKENPKFLEYVS